MKTERELFEDSFKLKWEIGHAILKMVKFIDESNDYAPINAVKTMSDEYYWVLALNTGWWAWLASAQREGYKLVPVEPTTDMWWEGKEELQNNGDVTDIYKAMIGASE